MGAPSTPRRYFAFGSFRLDPVNRVLFRDGEILPLSPKAIDTLLVLIEHRGAVVSKEELLKAVWPDTFVEEGSLTHNISLLRKMLAEDSGERPCIETVPKRGYRFVAPLTEVLNGQTRGAAPSEAAPPATIPAPAVPKTRRGFRSQRAWLAVGLAVVAVALLIRHLVRRAAAPEVRSLVVLPLLNLSGDSRQDYLADGLTEALISAISRIKTVRVISRTSAMHYKGVSKLLPDVARELKVDAALEGSMARARDRLRINLQLVHAATDNHLWAQTFEYNFVDVPMWQLEVAGLVAREIRASALPRAAGASPKRLNPAAFDDYLHGRQSLEKRNLDSVKTAVTYFRSAIDHDPTHALSYAGLADCYNQLGTVMMGSQSPAQTRSLAAAAAAKALELDPDLAEAHAALGYTQLFDWNWDGAERSLLRSIELNPSYGEGRMVYAILLIATGRTEEALREAARAQELDPLSLIVVTQTAWINHFARRYDEAIAQYRKVLDVDPEYVWALWQLGQACTYTARHPEAIRTLEKAAALSERSPAILASLGAAYALSGRPEAARRLLKELEDLSSRRYVPPAAMARIWFAFGNRDQGFAWLEHAWKERSNAIAFLAVWPMLDCCRADPRYQDLLRRIGLGPGPVSARAAPPE